MNRFKPAVLLALIIGTMTVLLPLRSQAETIKVGAILAVTGPASFLGGPEARTIEMLAQELNARGGINGKKIELIIKDSGGSPEKAVFFAKQLIEEEKVFAIIGPSTSGETMAIKQICENGKTILLSLAAAEKIVDPVAAYVFKTPQKDSFAARRIFNTMKQMGLSKIAVLSDNTGFGEAGKAVLTEEGPKFGIDIVISESYDQKATDLSAVIARLMADKSIQGVLNWSIVPAQSIVARNMRQAGWDVPLFQSHGFGNIRYVEAAGAAAQGIIFPAGRLLIAEQLPASNPQKEVLMQYKNAYEARYREEASTFGGHAYDAFKILTLAMETAGPDREKVRDAIENMKGFVGTGGIFNFSPADHNGLGVNSFTMVIVNEGKFVPFGFSMLNKGGKFVPVGN